MCIIYIYEVYISVWDIYVYMILLRIPYTRIFLDFNHHLFTNVLTRAVVVFTQRLPRIHTPVLYNNGSLPDPYSSFNF